MGVRAFFLLGMCVFLVGCGLPLDQMVDAAESNNATFTLVGPQQTITFSLPVSPAPDGYANQCAFNANTFCNMKVPVNVNGQVQALTTTFYGTGGVSLAAGVGVPVVDLVGAHLFTGSLEHPTFTAGTYSLVTVSAMPAIQQTYTLTVVLPKPR